MADINGVEYTYANKDEYDFEGGEISEIVIDAEMEKMRIKNSWDKWSEEDKKLYIKLTELKRRNV
tara:strand:- start:301 stop:495 length:195 start_codon:yes stop_codon:yes gene_type:complete